MKIGVNIEGKKRGFEEWIDGVTKRDQTRNMRTLGNNIKESLIRHSPVDTGEMADSWDYEVNKNGNKYVLDITNNSHDETHLSVPKLIHYGHGIKGGGYVRANPFITRAMNSVYDAEMTKLVKGLID